MENVIGKTYGLLTVLAEAERKGRDRRVLVRCGCESLNEKVVWLGDLRRGSTTSCGCLQKAIARVSLKATSTTHGLSKHQLYATWASMIKRCQDSKDSSYIDYGGRGITVCERWQKFENFTADMQPSHRKDLSLDRKDNNKGYSPENCRWATYTEQARNTRRNILITFQGQTQCLAAWCEKLNLKYPTVYKRIVLMGKTPEQALTT